MTPHETRDPLTEKTTEPGFECCSTCGNLRMNPLPTCSECGTGAGTATERQRFIQAMRKADVAFERVGGTTRHYVHDCLWPALSSDGLVVVDAAALAAKDEELAILRSAVERLKSETQP